MIIFNSIKYFQHRALPNTVDELIECVDLDREILDHVFLALKTCMVSTVLVEGENSDNISHINKTKLKHNGRLVLGFVCPQEAIDKAKSFII